MSAIKRVAVIGGGLMGNGIAQVTAAAGVHVKLVDMKDELVKKAIGAIQLNVSRGYKKAVEAKKMDENDAKKKTDEILSRIQGMTSTEEAVKDVDLVIESATENLAIKHKIFTVLDKSAPPNTILATNTSSLQIQDIGTVVNRGDKLAGLHFFNPVPMMKLVEVVQGPKTSQETMNSLLAFGQAIGKTTVRCSDTPGFVVNRLLVPNLFEAMRLVERGVATIEDTDTAMRLGANHPMGPFALADLVGLDTCKSIMDGWHKKFPSEPAFQPSAMLDKLVAQGHLGKKTGKGFYDYSK